MIAGLVEAFDIQGRICRGIGSPLYADLLACCTSELERQDDDSPLVRLLGAWEGDVARDFVPLRVLGGVHALVLAGRAPALAQHYPSVGGTPRFPACWEAFRATLAAHVDELEPWLERVPQTNEVQRCASLLGGFLEVAARFGRPLRLRELGASAGLNLLWSEFGYELGPYRWVGGSQRAGDSGRGRESVPLWLRAEWNGPAPELEAAVAIESRAGCDHHPIDVADPEARRRLEAWFWPDQVDRLERLRAAIDCFVRQRPRLECAAAPAWIGRELADGWPEGVCMVVYHSSFWGYLSDADRTSIRAALEAAGSSATESRPLAWLSADDDPPSMSLKLTCWPGGDTRRIARIHPHGRSIRWQRPGEKEVA